MSVSNEDVLHCVLQATLHDGTIVQNRKRFKADFAAPQSDAVVLNAVKVWVETLYGVVASQVPSSTDIDQGTVDVIAWNAVDSLWEVIQNVGVYTPLDTFAAAGDELPNQCSAFMIGNTARPKSKGRLFVWPFGNNQQDGGILSSGALTALGLMAGQYIADQPIGDDALLTGIVREGVDLWLPFITVSFDDLIGTQRRRRYGIGM